MIARSALEALTQSPLRLLRSAWPWRSLAYLLLSVIPGAFIISVGWLGGQLMGTVGPTLAGFTVVIVATPVINAFERLRLKLVDRSPALPRVRGSLIRRLRDSDAWREFAHALVAMLALWWIDLLVLAVALGVPGTFLTAPFQPNGTGPVATVLFTLAGFLLIPVAAYPLTAWAGARAAMSRAILGSQDELARSRARLMGAFELERRRIERDLHDGAQQRLVALSMKLGLAKLSADVNSPLYKEIDEAHEQAKLALSDLRELIRGVHPQVLSGRGLAAAVRDAAGRSPVPVTVDLPSTRLDEAAEVTAYYVVTEALANVAKHSGAQRAWVSGEVSKGLLRLEIGDDGVGGADPAAGSGLTGLADRISTLDGQFSVSSPAGGPTVVRVELPCSA
ncbi:sensor histidine kinase [Catelliglobosispora koreensis]|uniref:sensor histidine kinase n=1 Tax=Catelliglobosispora koreensis TaxID=129052 RepID=UPI0003A6D393|nr:sensor histidine kinase [Catelliglobosispora koreensis]